MIRDPERDAGIEIDNTDLLTGLKDPTSRVFDIAKNSPVTPREEDDRVDDSLPKSNKEIIRAQKDKKGLSIVSLENNLVGIKEFPL
jgi:hypothetical protein